MAWSRYVLNDECWVISFSIVFLVQVKFDSINSHMEQSIDS
jgi:hypothetical protein